MYEECLGKAQIFSKPRLDEILLPHIVDISRMYSLSQATLGEQGNCTR